MIHPVAIPQSSIPQRSIPVSSIPVSSGSRIRIRRLCTPLAAAILSLVAGCATPPAQPKIVDVPAQSFVAQWTATVAMAEKDAPPTEIRSLYLRGDQLYAYARDGRVFVFTANGGKLVYSDQVVAPKVTLRPPIILPDGRVVFPTSDTLEIYSKAGKRLQSLGQTERSIRGPGVAVGNTLYIGEDSTTGGRLASLDLALKPPSEAMAQRAKRMDLKLEDRVLRIPRRWEILTVGGIDSAPVVYQGIIYFATADSQVWAINEQGSAIWALPGGGNTFKAEAPILADLKADDVGVYAASQDGKLYCLDRGTGRIKWRYFGGTPLDTSPAITPTTVYQYAAGTGLAAIDKQTHGIAKPKWINERAVKYLGEDDKYVYATQDDGYLIGLDKTTGVRIFRGTRSDLAIFSAPSKDGTIYAATKEGEVFSIKAVLKPGTVGEMVMVEQELPLVAMAK